MKWIESIYFPIFFYHFSSSLFHPFINSLIYAQVCERHHGAALCRTTKVARDLDVQAEANFVLFAGSTALSICSMGSTLAIGLLMDKHGKSRIALLLPYIGVSISDLIVILQTLQIIGRGSTWLFVVSQMVFGLFGGFASVMSTANAHIVRQYSMNPEKKSSALARLSGVVGMGSTLGFLMASQLPKISYIPMSIFLFSSHVLCGILMAIITRQPQMPLTGARTKERCFFLAIRGVTFTRTLGLYLIASVASYLAVIGCHQILFLYLKLKFAWDAGQFGHLKAGSRLTATIMAIFGFAWLKRRGLSDFTMTVIGFISRVIAMLWYAVVWRSELVFFAIIPESLNRFAASGFRALIVNSVGADQQGRVLAVHASLESVAQLFASSIFHPLLPLSAKFGFPSLPFYIMSGLFLVAILLLR